MKRWAEHFDGVLNRPSSIIDEAINRLPQVECNPLFDELPTVSETVKAIKLLTSGKAPGSDAIPAEIYKAGGPPVAEKLTELFHIMWRREAIPQKFKDATIIHLFKRKGNPQVCDNHRGIYLLSVAGKILARVLLNRLNEYREQSGFLPESQDGFRKDRGTIDMIFTARQASLAQLDAPSDWRPGGRGFNPRRGRQHYFMEIDHEIFSTVILSLPLIHEGQLSVSGERMCTILVNRLED